MRDRILAANQETFRAWNYHDSDAVAAVFAEEAELVEGEYLGIAATGRRIEVRGATFSEFDADALVVRETNSIDVNRLLAQLDGG